MTVTGCKVRQASVQFSLGLRNDRRVTAIYDIDTDDSTQGGLSVEQEAQDTSGGFTNTLPKFYDTFSLTGDSDTTINCSRLELSQNADKPERWEARVTWSYLPVALRGVEADPLLRKPTYHFEYSTDTVEINQGWNIEAIGATGLFRREANKFGPIVNSAGQDYDEQLFEERKAVTLVITKNYNSDLHAIQLNNVFDRTTNATPMFAGTNWEVAKHAAKFDGATSSEAIIDDGVTYYEVTIRIRLQREPFYREIVNRGHQAWQRNAGTVEDPHKLINVTDDDGQETAEPRLLAADGTQLPSDELGNYIAYRTNAEVSYSQLESMIWP